MLSTCPSCLSQVSHADDLFDVTCSCGAHFSPYMNHNKDSHTEHLNYDGVDNSGEFSESRQTFAELRNFGENLGLDTVQTPAIEPEIPPTADLEPIPEVDSPITLPTPISEIVLTPGEVVQGHTLENYFNPVSVVCTLGSGDNPMDEAHQKLWVAIQAAGGNAGIGLRWVLNPSGDVVMSAIPVRVSKNS